MSGAVAMVKSKKRVQQGEVQMCWCYLKTGFTSWWVSAKWHNQAKEREKEGCVTCSK